MTAASCQFFSRKTALWLGLAGILGSLMLFSGDMLFYFNGDQTDVIANMAVVAPQRIILSGLTALFAAWLHPLGAGQVYYAFQPAARWLRLPVFLSFASIMVAYGIVHGAYVAIATAAQIAAQTGSAPTPWRSRPSRPIRAVRGGLHPLCHLHRAVHCRHLDEADVMSGRTPIRNENRTQKLLTPADSPDFMELLTYAVRLSFLSQT